LATEREPVLGITVSDLVTLHLAADSLGMRFHTPFIGPATPHLNRPDSVVVLTEPSTEPASSARSSDVRRAPRSHALGSIGALVAGPLSGCIEGLAQSVAAVDKPVDVIVELVAVGDVAFGVIRDA
jgi:hypothetical protein